MPQKTNGFERFWKELKRRNVVHVVTAYIAISFGILQLVDIASQPLNLPSWTLKYLIIILCIGLVLAAILSWIYDITSGRIKKTVTIASLEAEKELPIPEQSNSWKIISYISLAIIFILITYNVFSWGKSKEFTKLEKSVAVLPFLNDSASDSTTYFINGVMEDILNDLQKIKDLRVISRTSVEQYRNTTKSIPVIAKELGVNYIVEGSGQKSGNAFRLSTQLLRAKKESHIWGKTYEKDLYDAKDVFRIQSQIAESIASELEAAITLPEKQLIEKIPTSSLAAYQNCILGGSHLAKYTKEDSEIALQYFEKAKEIDPQYVAAYLGIMSVWHQRAQLSYSAPVEAYPLAKASLDKAFSLDSTSPEIYSAITQNHIYIDWDFKGAESSIKKCLSLNPNDLVGNMHYGALLLITGRSKESVKQHLLTLKLEPLSIALKVDYGLSLYCAGRSNNAVKVFKEVLNANPDNMVALGNLPLALHDAGRYSEELEIWKLYYKTVFKDFANVFDQGYKNGGIIGALNLQGDSLVDQSKTKFIQPNEIAVIYGCAGNKERTLDFLERCYEVHDSNLPFYFKAPVFEFVQNEPRYQNLLRKLNLPI